MKTFLHIHAKSLSVIIMTCATILYIIQKTDAFAMLRFTSHTTLLYGIWLMTFSFFVYITLFLSKGTVSRLQTIFAGLAPSAVFLCLTPFFIETHIHQFITALTGFYFIAYGFLFIYTYHKKQPIQQKVHKKLKRSHLIMLIITSCLYLYFGIDHLGKAFYVDEKLWIYDRIETYWDNIITGDWYNTRPSDKPGVTTALVSGPGLLFFDPSTFNEGTLHKDQLEQMFFALRFPLLISIFFCILITFFCARKVITAEAALLFFVFLCLSPLLLGIARMINPDALLWIFFLVSFLCFLRHLFDDSLSALYCAGAFLGLSLLTKYIANIFIVFYFFIILIDPIIRKRSPINILRSMRMRLTQFGIMIIVALSIFYIFYPGAWVKHDRILLATIHSEAFASTWIYFAVFICLLIADVFFYRAKITSVILHFLHVYRLWIIYGILSIFTAFILLMAVNVYTNMSLFDFTYIIESPKSVYRDVGPFALFSASFYPLIFGVTPIVILGLIFGIFHILRSREWQNSHVIIFYSIVFILMYYAGSIINHVMPIVRYQIVLYPLIILIASIGWTMSLSHFFKKDPRNIILLCSLILLCESVQLFALHHFYFSYNSPILPDRYIINSKDMGDGNYEVAQYLNTLPNAENLLVWTDKTGLCQFFVGSCNNMIQDLSLIEIVPQIDYYIISQNRKNYIERLTLQKKENRADYPLRLDRLYNIDTKKEFELFPGGRKAQFIRVIRSNDVNIIDQ